VGDEIAYQTGAVTGSGSLCSLARAEGSSLPYSGSGPIGPEAIIQRYNKSGELFRVEGRCQSSCTMLLVIKNVYVDPSATIFFHAALFLNEASQRPLPRGKRLC